jgi:hypothetical protein
VNPIIKLCGGIRCEWFKSLKYQEFLETNDKKLTTQLKILQNTQIEKKVSQRRYKST